jgi:hypothetical protein
VRLLHHLLFILTLVISWVRVVEVGSERTAEEAAIKAAQTEYEYWGKVQRVVLSEPMVLQSCDSSWTAAVSLIRTNLVEAKGKAWVNSPKIEQ